MAFCEFRLQLCRQNLGETMVGGVILDNTSPPTSSPLFPNFVTADSVL